MVISLCKDLSGTSFSTAIVTANVVRALTLVPDALRDWRNLGNAQYLSFAGMQNFVQDPDRSINRMQTELIAGRVSAVNECFY